ncbi:MAG: HAD-IA family hydrolase [Candidatus Dormibacteraeota bacterium]|nr:HAD-IA family hydrolase [Candidatus Dormibacteraeota bacterium]
MEAAVPIRLALIDLDGTVYAGTRVIDGAAGAVRRVRDLGVAVRFTTNTDSVTPVTLVRRLAGMGVEAELDEVLTPVVLARALLDEEDGTALVIASHDVRSVLAGRIATGGERVTHVIVADPSYGAGYAELDAAFRAIREGAQLVAMQLGRWVQRDSGVHLDTGGWVRLLEYAAEVDALLLGKPSPDFFRLATESAGVDAAHTLVVGDDRASDVAGGRAAGCHTVLVRTGKGTVSRGPEPDLVIDSVADVPDVIVNNSWMTGSR